MIIRFLPGKTYSTRSLCDHDCVIQITVISRTAKTITIMQQGMQKLLRVFEREGVEYVRPWGNYSMAPAIDAKD